MQKKRGKRTKKTQAKKTCQEHCHRMLLNNTYAGLNKETINIDMLSLINILNKEENTNVYFSTCMPVVCGVHDFWMEGSWTFFLCHRCFDSLDPNCLLTNLMCGCMHVCIHSCRKAVLSLRVNNKFLTHYLSIICLSNIYLSITMHRRQI